MPELDRRADIHLETFRRVAWKGEPVILSDAARERIAAARRAFLGYIEAYPERRVYGANTRVGSGVKTVLEDGDLRAQSARHPDAAGDWVSMRGTGQHPEMGGCRRDVAVTRFAS